MVPGIAGTHIRQRNGGVTMIPAVANSTNGRIRREEDPSVIEKVHRLFAAFLPEIGANQLQIDRLALGGQARILLVRLREGQPMVVGGDVLVVKLFHANVKDVHQVIDNSFESLARLHSALDGNAINGWTIRSPRTMHRSKDVPSIIMSMVKGQSLHSMLAADGSLDDAVFRTIGQTVSTSLQRYWSAHSRLYGDLNLHNVLCDPATRTISFVDCGVPGSAWHCEGADNHFYPASRDLAYLMYYGASSVRASIGRPRARRRQKWLTRLILKTCVRQIASPDRRQALLDEIEACSNAHLATIQTSWSPRGVWRRLVRASAAYSMRRTLNLMSREILRPDDAMSPDSPLEVTA
jgi:hypothetical protein